MGKIKIKCQHHQGYNFALIIFLSPIEALDIKRLLCLFARIDGQHLKLPDTCPHMIRIIKINNMIKMTKMIKMNKVIKVIKMIKMVKIIKIIMIIKMIKMIKMIKLIKMSKTIKMIKTIKNTKLIKIFKQSHAKSSQVKRLKKSRIS